MTSTASNWEALQKRLDNVKKPVRTFKLCDDTDIRDRYLTAKREADQVDDYLKQFKTQTKGQQVDSEALALVEKQAKDAATELAAAQKVYDQHTIVLRFQALERQDLEDLMAKHPPTEQDEANGNDFAEDTFAPALISAASLDGMPIDDATRYLNTWTAGDARGLWNAAWSVQHTQRTDLGKG